MLIKLGKYGELFVGRQDIFHKELTDSVSRMPHCDARILHAPGKCHHCDLFADFQQYRLLSEINFTGENDLRKSPCPSLWTRTAAQRDAWPRNRAEKTKYAQGGLVIT